MALIKNSNRPLLGGSLFSDFDDDRFFYSPWLNRQSMPAVNVKENDKNYEVEIAVPGYDKKDFNISVENGILTVSAEKKEETEKKDENYSRKEFGYTSFSRSFSLPENIREDDIEARYQDGVLRLAINKKNLNQPRVTKAIEIK